MRRTREDWKASRRNLLFIGYISFLGKEGRIRERLNMLGLRKWRMDIDNSVQRIPSVNSEDWDSYHDDLHSTSWYSMNENIIG